VEQNRDPTNRNRIRGRAGRTSGQGFAKSISIKGQSCKSGGCATKDAGLTPGGLHRVLFGTGGVVRRPDRGAEVSRGRSSRGDPMKVRTAEEESSDTRFAAAMRQNSGIVRPARQDRRVKPDGLAAQGLKPPRRCVTRSPGPLSSRKEAGSIRRTAVYGPVRTVVWEGRSREAPPYPD